MDSSSLLQILCGLQTRRCAMEIHKIMLWVCNRSTGCTPTPWLSFCPCITTVFVNREKTGLSSSCWATNTSKDTENILWWDPWWRLALHWKCFIQFPWIVQWYHWSIHTCYIIDPSAASRQKWTVMCCLTAEGRGLGIFFLLEKEYCVHLSYIWKEEQLTWRRAFCYNSHKPGKNSRLQLKSLFVLFLKCLFILFALIKRENLTLTNKPSESLPLLIRAANL